MQVNLTFGKKHNPKRAYDTAVRGDFGKEVTGKMTSALKTEKKAGKKPTNLAMALRERIPSNLFRNFDRFI